MWNRVDLTDMKFGRLTVLGVNKIHTTPCGHKERLWLCLCDCGNATNVCTTSLRKGTTKSCGCLGRDARKARYTTHGLSCNELYDRWKHMLNRCELPTDKRYRYYGERGIFVCEEWHDFTAFNEWAAANGYAKGLSLDRIDNGGPYSPENCRWADHRTQMNNTRATRLIEYHGKLTPLSVVAAEHGMTTTLLHQRIFKLGWPLERALASPVKKRRAVKHLVGGAELTVAEISRLPGAASPSAIYDRLRKGWDPEDAAFAKS